LETKLQDIECAGNGERVISRAKSVSLINLAHCLTQEFLLPLTYTRRDDAVETAIAEEYKNNLSQFEKTAKQWTKQYAK